MQPAGYFWRGPHVETGAKTPGTMPNLYQTGQSREAQLWIFEKSEDQRMTRPACRGPFLFPYASSLAGKTAIRYPKRAKNQDFLGEF
jgi:hypothetical protein